MVRTWFLVGSGIVLAVIAALALLWPGVLWSLVVLGPLIALGLYDILQKEHTVLRNFPLIGHGRYFMEMVRPEIQQYFVESNTDGTPFPREARSLVYQRAKGELQTLPLGTQHDVYAEGYEWMNHSLAPIKPPETERRLRIGGDACTKPYEASRLNISAMSFGSLSGAAILALNGGAKLGGFCHNTGEGGLSRYHLEPKGDLVWQIGTAYFGCRDPEGRFDPERFREGAAHAQVRMIEVKLSQGAKPGHGGILPGVKVTPEIAAARGVPVGRDVISPPAHSTFSTPTGLLEFVARLRELSGGKPVGFKLCIGDPVEFLAIVKAMTATGILPDFITVDGAEGGTGAAPLEFSNSVGMPMREGLLLVHNTLTGIGLRGKVRVIAAGKVVSGFDLFRLLALGADAANSARAMMFALGCIQARRCHANVCPTGIATQDARLQSGLDVARKSRRVARYHQETIRSFHELLGGAGLASADEIRAHHVLRRVDDRTVRRLDEIYAFLPAGALLEDLVPEPYRAPWSAADPSRWRA